MEFLIIGIVSALNLIVIIHKFKRGRIEDGILDTALFILVTIMFSGQYAGMVVAMVASLVISIYLLACPPTFFRDMLQHDEVKRLIKEVKAASSQFKNTSQRNNNNNNNNKKQEINFD